MKYTLTRIPHLLALLALIAAGILLFAGRTVNTDTSLFATGEEASSTIPVLVELPPIDASSTPTTTVPEESVGTTTPEILDIVRPPSTPLDTPTPPALEVLPHSAEYCHSKESEGHFANPGECMRTLQSR